MRDHSTRALALCSPGHGDLHLFVGAQNGVVRHRTFDGSWSAWRDLGSPWSSPGEPRPGVTGTPAGFGSGWLDATAVEGGAVEVFALGAEGDLRRLRLDDEGRGRDRPEWMSCGVLPRGLLPQGSAPTGFTVVTTGGSDVHVLLWTGAPDRQIVHWRPSGRAVVLPVGGRASGLVAAVAEAAVADAARGVLLVADTRERRLLRGHFTVTEPPTYEAPAYEPPTDGPPTDEAPAHDAPTWEDLGELPDGLDPSPTCIAATEHDVFLGGDRGLWHSALEPWLGWEHLGGDLSAPDTGLPLLTAVESGDGRIDVLAVWAGAALMHRRFDTAWSAWHLVDLPSATPGTTPGATPGTAPGTAPSAAPTSYAVLRPDDLVTLTLRGRGLHEQTRPDGTVQLVPDPGGGRLIVEVPPQHLAETVVESGMPPQGYLSGPSTLSFAVGPDPVVLTVEGLLDAMERLPLVTTAASAADEVTRLELPWRLVLALQGQPRCAHRSRPATGTGGGTELWHSRVHDPAGGLTARPLRAVPGGTNLGTPLDAWLDQIVAAAVQNPGIPVAVDRLILSAYGARFSASAHWPHLEWAHDAALGRDFHVKVAATGALFPFGHRAVYVEVTDRRFDGTDPAVAALHRQSFLIVTEPVRDDYGVGAGGSHERRFPFQRVTIDPGQASELDDASWIPLGASPGAPRCFWPRRSGGPVMFTLRAGAGQQEVELHLPLLFVEDAAADAAHAAALDGIYGGGPGSGAFAGPGRPVSDVGSRIPLAMVSRTEAAAGAVQEVQSMTFGGLGAGHSPTGVGFYPQVTQLAVGLPAARQLLGPLPALPATLSKALVDTPPGQPPAEALLDLVTPRPLDFGAAGARAGSLAAPDMTVTQISRTLGPTVGNALPQDPTKLFAPDATLFGVVPLRDLIAVVRDQPKLLWLGEGTDTPSAKLTWRQPLEKALAPFYPDAGSSVSIEALAQLVGGKPQMHATGTIDRFRLVIPAQGPGALVTLTFASVVFTADAGRSLHLDVTLSDVELDGTLKFLRTLQDLIPQAGRGGPRIDVSATAITASYTLAVPTAGLMVFSLQNLTIRIAVTLSLTNRPIAVDFAFGTREKPFLVTVSGFGGGGYLELGIGAGGPDSGLQRLTGGIEFGAAVTMDFAIASAEVHVFGGVVFAKNGRDTEITGYLRIGGSVSVLGLISVSIELTLSLTYDTDTNVLSGSARLVITVDLTFFSKTVTLECHKSFGGSSHLAAPAAHAGPALAAGPDPSSVEAALGPQGPSFPWQTYCQAFAGE
ncbi:hypothetical protein [Kitasatospora sp. NPDC096140]|uniref:hypothetical protein n=1 Tax=Kitasatospora sp. NPDC096140 TaxID=3155425 RepID=UPI00332310E5